MAGIVSGEAREEDGDNVLTKVGPTAEGVISRWGWYIRSRHLHELRFCA